MQYLKYSTFSGLVKLMPEDNCATMSSVSYSLVNVRHGFRHYLLGRGITAIASFAVALLLVNGLSVESYGVYTALSGLTMVLLTLSGAGLERVLPKFLPELRLAQAGRELTTLNRHFFAIRILLISLFLLPLTLLPALVEHLFPMSSAASLILPFSVYTLCLAASTYLSRALQALLLQQDATTGMALDWYSKLGILLGLLFWRLIDLHTVIWVFAGTSALGALYMSLRLRVYLRHMNRNSQGSHAIDHLRIWRFGRDNYLQNLVGLPTTIDSAKVFSSAWLGAEATAFLGFANSITSVLNRYLPATLLLGLIEPVFMARYRQDKNFEILREMGSIVLKINIFFIAPVAAWLLFNGDVFLDLISGGKYGQAIWIVLGLVGLLMFESHRAVLQLITNAVDESILLLSSNTLALLAVSIQILLALGLGLPGLLIGMILVSWFRNFYLVFRLRQRGYPYVPHWSGILRMTSCALAAGGLGYALTQWIPGLLGAGLAAVAVAGSFLALTYVWKPFKPSERAMVNRFLGRPAFVW